jgi:hypothetical protein
MNLFKKISSKNIKEGFNLEDFDNKRTDGHDVVQVVPRQIRKEDITYDAILQQDGNPEYQARLVLESDPNKIASIHIFSHCGNNRRVQYLLAERMAAEPGNRRFAPRAYLKSFKDDPWLQFIILASALPPKCCCLCSPAHWGKYSFKGQREKDMATYICEDGQQTFNLTVFRKYRHDPLFQFFYLLRTDNYGQIAANIDAILQECANDEVRAIANQKAESFNRLQASMRQATAMTPLLFGQTDPNYVLIPGAVPEDVSAGYFQLAADAHEAYQEPRMFDPQFQSDSR